MCDAYDGCICWSDDLMNGRKFRLQDAQNVRQQDREADDERWTYEVRNFPFSTQRSSLSVVFSGHVEDYGEPRRKLADVSCILRFTCCVGREAALPAFEEYGG